jgi:taurine transport system permease protein
MIGLVISRSMSPSSSASFLAVRFLVHKTTRDFTSLKTVTFGDESAVAPNRIASVVSVMTIFLIWGSVHRLGLGAALPARARDLSWATPSSPTR